MQKLNRKIRIITIFLVAMLLCGCSKNDDINLGDNEKNSVYLDNSLDKYSAFFYQKIDLEEPSNALAGGHQSCFIGDDRGYRFKKHLFTAPEDRWDEISILSTEGKSKSIRLSLQAQVWSVGRVLQSNHILCSEYVLDNDMTTLHIVEIDEDQTVYKDIILDSLNTDEMWSLDDMVMDTGGNVHFVARSLSVGDDDMNRSNDVYTIVSPDGELLYSDATNDKYRVVEIVCLPDGTVAYKVQDDVGKTVIEEWTTELFTVDLNTLEVHSLWRQHCSAQTPFYRATVDKSNAIIYASTDGIYAYDRKIDDSKTLYLFRNHGMVVKNIWGLQTDAAGGISLIYEDDNGNHYYLCLQETQHQTEILTIEFAVNENNISHYRNAIAMFNKTYPTYHIELVTDREKDRLTTELISGKGPVLLDSSLIGFEANADLWLDLEPELRKEFTDALLTQVLNMGRIDGQLLGIVSSFSIETLVINDENIHAWSYDDFVDYIDAHREIPYICDNAEINNLSGFINDFMSQDVWGTYFFNENEGVAFDAMKFEKALDLALRQADNQETILPGDSLLGKKAILNRIRIDRPEQLDLFRMVYGDNINYVGYPTKNGSVHYLTAYPPVCVRKSATDKEIEIACDFIKLLLSYDGQAEAIENSAMAFSVRKDVLQKQFDRLDKNTVAFAFGFDEEKLGDGVDISLDRMQFDQLMMNSKKRNRLPDLLNDILMVELQRYEVGEVEKELCISNIGKRIQLYFDENM